MASDHDNKHDLQHSYDDWKVIGTRFAGLVFRMFLSENCYTLFLTLVL